ncbi:hypothetical protein [Thioclava sp. F28-4]|uniref:hypothetical protein n=1 Tax=Thioclava sp. F28-4 TaxID=1915315 RepID=UPI0009967FC8|nr:hypothetical protein [Thioclava sp. F28-4]OOY02932.1 hypothetical protein BMI87_20120 [Thioclava sp. F28-4]
MTNQGRNGQWRFADLCTGPDVSVEAVVNPASDDQHGWDHMLEITPPQNNIVPADLQAHVISCFAQIKTTRGKKAETTVKLSNAVKAAKSPLPSFVFLFHYNKAGKPVLYGKHIWKDEIRHYLKRARQAGDAPLHKKTVTVKFTAADRLSCNPVEWVLAVLSTCGGDAYTLEKRKYVDSVGYETETHTGNFELGPLKSHADVVMHEIGLLADLPVTNFILFDTRFGIKASTPLQELTDGRVSFTQEGRPVTVKLRSSNDDEIELPGLAWAPSMIPLEHPEFRIRVKAGHIDIVARPGNIDNRQTTQLNVQFDLQEERPFIEQAGLLALINWSSFGPVSANVEVARGQLFCATINLNAPLESWAKECWVCARYFLNVLGSERCKTTSIALLDFYRFMRDYFALASIQESASIRFEGLFECEMAEFSKLVGYGYGQFGDWTFGAIHEFEVVSQSQEGEKLIVYLTKPRIAQKFVFARPLAQSVEHIARDFQSFLARQAVPVATFDDGDLFEWGRSYKRNGTVAIQVHNPPRSA